MSEELKLEVNLPGHISGAVRSYAIAENLTDEEAVVRLLDFAVEEKFGKHVPGPVEKGNRDQ